MRLFLVDTLTALVFFTLVAAASELWIAGMALRDVVMTRAIMAPVMVATGRPYGLWRDLWFRRFAPRGRAGVIALDVAAFLSFQVPVYALTLRGSGASGPEMAKAIGSAVFFMILLSRPFGLLLDRMRRLAKVAQT